MLITSLGAPALAAMALVSLSPTPTAQDQAVVQPLGGGTVGAGGIPQVGYYGAPVVGRPFALRLEGGAPFAFGALALSASAAPVDLPAFGATVHPLAPYVALEGLALDASGRSVGIFPVTAVVPSLVGVEVWAQGVIADGAAVGGLAFTDARRFFFGEARAEAFNNQLLPQRESTVHARFADVDGDGSQDVVQLTSTALLVRIGRGDETFEPPIELAYAAGALTDVLDLDVNGDGHLDLVIATGGYSGTSRVDLLHGDGAGAFTLVQTLPVSGPSYDLERGDVDADGFADVVVASANPNNEVGVVGELSVLMGGPSGLLTPGWSVGGELDDFYQAFVEDLDLDGDLDLMARGDGSYAYLGANDGTFTAVPFQPTIFGSGSVMALGDVTGDGVPDAIGFKPSKLLVVHEGVGDGTFTAADGFGSTDYEQPASLVDFDADGHLDVIAAEDGAWTAWLGDGVGGFTARSLGTSTGLSFKAGPLQLADLDGDGRPSLLLQEEEGGALIQELDGAERFQSSKALAQNPLGAARSWHVADMDGDGLEDLVGTTPTSNVLLHLGLPDGRFAPSVATDTGIFVECTTVADLDGDGLLDLIAGEGAATSSGRSEIAVLLSTAPGVLGAPTHYQAGWSSGSVASADFDGDGAMDVAAAGEATGELTVFLGVGDGTLAPAGTTFTTGFPVSLDAYDATGDGVADLVALARGVDQLLVLAGRGDGTFDPPLATAVGTRGPWASATVLELNGDGVRDVAVVDPTLDEVVLFTGDGAGGFVLHQQFLLDFQPEAVGAADVDRDGRPDLLLAGGHYTDATQLSVARGSSSGSFDTLRTVHVEPFSSVCPGSFFDADLDGLVDVLFARGATHYLLKSGLYR